MLGSHFEHQIGDVLVALHGREELLPVAEHFRGVREPCKARILLSVLVSVMTPCLRNFLPHSRLSLEARVGIGPRILRFRKLSTEMTLTKQSEVRNKYSASHPVRNYWKFYWKC